MLWRVRGECSCGFNAGCDETGVWRESGNHGLEPQSSLRHSLGVCAEHQSIGTRRSNRVCDHRELHVVCRWKRQIFIACLLTHAHEPKHACAHGLVCTLTPGTSASSKLRLIPSASQRMTLTMPKSMPSNSSTPQKWEARKRKFSLFHARAHTHALYPLTLQILIQPEYDGFVVTHSPVLCRLFERFNKPIILVNSCRYDQPYCHNHNQHGREVRKLCF